MVDKKIHEIELFNDKSNFLLYSSEYDLELSTWAFFEDVFMRDSTLELPFEARMCKEYVDWRDGLPYRDEQPFVYNAVAIELVKKKDGIGLKQGRRWVIFNSDNVTNDPIRDLQDGEFVITSPLSYIGKSRSAKNARYAYGLAIDLDGVGSGQLVDICHQMRNNIIPEANIIVNSGHGVHLYYLFEKPIALFKNIADVLQNIKMSLIEVIWNEFTSSEKVKQKLGIYQGFRVPGTPTKLGKDIKVRAFRRNNQKYWSIKELNEYVWKENQLKQWEIDLVDKAKFKEDRLTKKQAKTLYPEWYERVIIKGDKNKKSWVINRSLYEWWLRQLKEEGKVQVGHRFLCLLALAMYAKKCNVPFEELQKDCYSLVEQFEQLTISDDNHFSIEDAEDALKAYKDDFCFVSRQHIERITGIRIEKNKRNKRKQHLHLKIARASRDILQEENGTKWDDNNGRPVATPENSKECKLVKKWREKNPNNINKSLCARETGLSRPTVRKWWSS